MPRPRDPPTPSGGDVPNVSCGRCRRRKIRCNRQRPCSQCTRAGEDCVFPGGGERQKPAPRRYVQALETRVASLESLLQQVASANDESARRQVLASVGIATVDAVVDNNESTNANTNRHGNGNGNGNGNDNRNGSVVNVMDASVDVPIVSTPTLSPTNNAGLPMLADAAALADQAEARAVDVPVADDDDTIMVDTPSSSSCSAGLVATASAASVTRTGDMAVARVREGRLRKLTGRKATQFYGGTSLFQLQLSESRTGPMSPSATTASVPAPTSAPISTSTPTPPAMPTSAPIAPTAPTPPSTDFPYPPQGDMCRQLLGYFFKNVYQYYFCVYREYFLRDYAAGGGPYYSDMLLFCICAVGARISPEPEKQALAPVFVERAESLLLASLHQPELTTLQALLMLAQIEIGQGRGSKGWLFCGMACRLTHEMGLHLDPTNWTANGGQTGAGQAQSQNQNQNQSQPQNQNQGEGQGQGGNNRSAESAVDREILRRVYWATFTVDKHLSLYFGRPPALYPHEADVRNTIRIPYPSEWQSLIDNYISPGTSATAFEDSVTVAGTFIYHTELAKVLHALIVDVFETRRGRSTTAPKTNAIGQIVSPEQHVHDRLLRWLAMLPQRLHWTPWTTTTTIVTAAGHSVPPYILHLHLVFHTAMIILHRPPRSHLEAPSLSDATMSLAASEDVEICYESLGAILRLLRTYTRQHEQHKRDHYRLALLPLDIVHTLSTAAGVVLMRRHLERMAWTDRDVAQPLNQLLDAMRAVQPVYPCMTEILDAVVEAVATGRAQDQARAERAATAGGGSGGGSGGGGSTALFNMLDSGCSPPQPDLGVMHILNSGVGIETGIGTLPLGVANNGGGGMSGVSGAGGNGAADTATAHTDESPASTDVDTTLGFLVTDDFLNGVGDFDWGGYP
ncbi:hypothetical protein SBRCBS47491_002453 [Sporothrix bragantina]|uniref:Zn(2)-C6 fungal-type domain-containing protein n=1 Tax=Sporothrix bragantina TaxID=671064 RepID=A0ABP0B720_9PEZI